MKEVAPSASWTPTQASFVNKVIIRDPDTSCIRLLYKILEAALKDRYEFDVASPEMECVVQCPDTTIVSVVIPITRQGADPRPEFLESLHAVTLELPNSHLRRWLSGQSGEALPTGTLAFTPELPLLDVKYQTELPPFAAAFHSTRSLTLGYWSGAWSPDGSVYRVFTDDWLYLIAGDGATQKIPAATIKNAFYQMVPPNLTFEGGPIWRYPGHLGSGGYTNIEVLPGSRHILLFAVSPAIEAVLFPVDEHDRESGGVVAHIVLVKYDSDGRVKSAGAEVFYIKDGHSHFHNWTSRRELEVITDFPDRCHVMAYNHAILEITFGNSSPEIREIDYADRSMVENGPDYPLDSRAISEVGLSIPYLEFWRKLEDAERADEAADKAVLDDIIAREKAGENVSELPWEEPGSPRTDAILRQFLDTRVGAEFFKDWPYMGLANYVQTSRPMKVRPLLGLIPTMMIADLRSYDSSDPSSIRFVNRAFPGGLDALIQSAIPVAMRTDGQDSHVILLGHAGSVATERHEGPMVEWSQLVACIYDMDSEQIERVGNWKPDAIQIPEDVRFIRHYPKYFFGVFRGIIDTWRIEDDDKTKLRFGILYGEGEYAEITLQLAASE